MMLYILIIISRYIALLIKRIIFAWFLRFYPISVCGRLSIGKGLLGLDDFCMEIFSSYFFGEIQCFQPSIAKNNPILLNCTPLKHNPELQP
jgi:hypothetical protein